MKIAFYNYLPLEYGGGTANFFIEISTGLKKKYPDLDIAIVTFDKFLSQKILKLYSIYFNVKFTDNDLDRESTNNILTKLGDVRYIQADNLVDLTKKLQTFDVIYSKNDFVEAFILKFLIRYSKLPPIIYGFHTPVKYTITKSLQSKFHNILYSSFLYRYMISGARKYHVLNNYDESILKKWHPQITVSKIYNPIDFTEFNKSAKKYKDKIKFNPKKINILWIGRITEQKGIDDLLFIIDKVKQFNNDKIIWNIVGDGDQKVKLLNNINKWDNVFCHGYVRHEFIPGIYEKHDLLISTSMWECFPYNIIEAQSFGLPVICYNIPGCTDIIDDNNNGFLVSDKNEFVSRIISFKKNQFNKNFISKKIRKRISNENIFTNFYNLLS